MSVLGKALILSFYELRLLLRSGGRLLVILCLPVVVGAMGSAASYGLFVVLAVSAVLMAGPGAIARTISLLPPSCVGSVRFRRVLSSVSRMLAALPVLLIQVLLYCGVTALVDPLSAPGAAAISVTLALALAVGFAACILCPAPPEAG